MFGVIRKRTLCLALAALMCFSMFPISAALLPQAQALTPEDMEPMFLLMENTHQYVTEIPAGKPFAVSAYWGPPDKLISVSLIDADGSHEYVLYKNGQVYYGGREYSEEEGPYYMVDFSAAEFAPGDYYVLARTADGDCRSNETVTILADANYKEPPAITTTVLPDAKQFEAYSFTLKATPNYGGAITWEVAAGTLPAGLALNAKTGVLSGTPENWGSAYFSVTATEAGGGKRTASISLKVEQTPLYTVRFDPAGGSPRSGVDYGNKSIKNGGVVKLPAAPNRPEYKFVGWQTAGGDVYLPGAVYSVQDDVTFTAQWTDRLPTAVSLPAGFAKTAGSVWLTGDESYLWSDYYNTEALPAPQIQPYSLAYATYSRLTLYGYVNSEPTALAGAAGSFGEDTESVALTATGEKWEILKGVQVNGLTLGADYTLGAVTWTAGKQSGRITSYPCMVRPGNTYTVELRFNKNGDPDTLLYTDTYTVTKLTNGYLRIDPAAVAATAKVSGTVTLGGSPNSCTRITVSQTVNDYTRTVSVFTDIKGVYSVMLLPGVPATFSAITEWSAPYVTAGETLADPQNGKTHDVSLRYVSLTAEITVKTAGDAKTAGRYLKAISEDNTFLGLYKEGKHLQNYGFSYRYLGDTLTLKMTESVHNISPNDSCTLQLLSHKRGEKILGETSADVRFSGGKGSAKLQTELHAGAVVSLSAASSGYYILAWYDAAGNYVESTPSFWLSDFKKDVAVQCPAAEIKNYTLVLLPSVYNYYAFLSGNKLNKLADDQAVARWRVTLKKTQIAALSDFRVDSVTSENAKYITKPHSTLSVSKSGFSGKDELISFYGSIGLDPGLGAGVITELQLSTSRGSAPSLIPQAITVNGTSYPFEASHGNFTADLSDLAAGGIQLPCSYTIYAKPYAADADMQLELTAAVKAGGFSFRGELIGSAAVAKPGASMQTVSENVCGDTVRLNGTAKANEKVTVYDGGVAIGSAKADDSGKWQGAFPLAGVSAFAATRHRLYAVSASGVHTNECIVTHRKGGPELKDIRMWYENKAPISLGGTYSVAQTMRDVHFSAEFKNPDQLDDLPGWNSKVVLRVYLGNGDIRLLETKKEKDGTFTASIDYVSGFITAAEAIFNAKAPAQTVVKENTGGSLTCAADADTKQAFADVSSIMRSCIKETNGKTVFNGKSQKDSFSVSFKNGKATLGGNAKGAAEGTTEAELKSAMESAAAELKAGDVNAENFGINYGGTQNTMEWLNAVGEEQAAKNEAAGKNAKLSYFYRTNLLSDKTSFSNAKAAVEKYAVNLAWNENAAGKNHTKLDLGSNRTFDAYVITDMQDGDDGTPESGTYFIQFEFYSDTTAKPAIYLAAASVILDGGFRGYAGLRDGSGTQLKGSILSLFTVRANAWEQGIYSSFHGKYSENAAYEQYCKMESATGDASLVTGTIGSAITLTPGASKGLSAMGTYFSAAGLSASIYNLGYVLHNNGYRIHVRVFMDGDLRRLIDSPCYKRLTKAQQQMCDDAYDKFKKAAERADKIDTRITGVSVGLCGGSIAASGIGMVQKLAKPAAKAGLAISAGSVALSAGTNNWIKDSFDEMTRAYEDAYNKIESIILGQSARTNSDDCKKVKRNGKDVIVYNVTFDPAGVVYEGVIENPVENALVTLWYGVDADGKPVKEADAKNVKRVIPAADVEEKSPVETTQVTGADGRYQWFVPEGLWYVTAEAGGLKGDSGADIAATVQITGTKADGKTVTKLLPVLPVQLDVNIPLTDPTAPAVESVRFTTDGVYVTYTKYMVDTAKGADSVLNPANYAVSNAGGAIAVTGVQAVEQGHTPANIDGANTRTYTRTVLVKLKTAPKSGDELLLCVKKGVKSYAGAAMKSAHYESGTVGANAAPGAPVIAGGATQTIAYGSPVAISLPENAPANTEIRYTTDGTAPTAESALYTGPIGAERNMTVRAVTVCPGYPNSKEAKTAVTVAETLAFELAGDVITSDGSDPAGITLTVTGKNYKKTVTVAKGGSYALENVPVGSYTVSFAGNGSYEAAEVKTEISTAAPWATLHLTATFKPGDVNNDGAVTAADARYALRAAVGLDDTAEGLDFSDPANLCYRAADVDGEAGISAADARLILRAAVGLETLA